MTLAGRLMGPGKVKRATLVYFSVEAGVWSVVVSVERILHLDTCFCLKEPFLITVGGRREDHTTIKEVSVKGEAVKMEELRGS